MSKALNLVVSNLFILLTSCLTLTPVVTGKTEKHLNEYESNTNNYSIPKPEVTPVAIVSSDTKVITQEKNLNISTIEKLIHEKTNQEREKLGLNKLEYEAKVGDIARDHSKNMAENNFFDHVNLQGLSPSDRISKNYPTLLTFGSAENIASNFGDTDEEAATNLIKAWMNSEGHRKNILNSNFTYIGVGVYIKDKKIYATQNFIKPLAVLESTLNTNLRLGETITPIFKFYTGSIDKNNLTIFVKFPDSNSKFYLPNNSYFIGQGKYSPQWLDTSRFTVPITCDRGIGTYIIQICENTTCFDSNFKILVN